MPRSGCRIDMHQNGDYEITYFGNFSQIIGSQTIIIRGVEDLIGLRDAIDRNLRLREEVMDADSK